MQLSAATAPQLNVEDILSAPIEQPLSALEERVLGVLLRRKARACGTDVGLPIHTGGKPAYVSFLPAAQHGSSEASRRTRGRREYAMREIETFICGEGETDTLSQRAFNLATLDQAERESLLVDTKITVPAEDVVSLGLQLRLSNEQQRKLWRWTKLWHVQLASERATQKASSQLIGEVTVAGEMVQTVCYSGNREAVMAPAPYCRVTNLDMLVVQHLDAWEATGQLTWHETPEGAALPANEIWLKVEAGKGGGSLKLCFQVVNRKAPSSADHTVVLALLEADDSLQNMHVCTDPFANALKELQGKTWRSVSTF